MGKFFANLTKSGVQSPDGQTSLFDNPAAAGKELAAESARTAAPGRSTVDGTIGAPTVTTTQPGAVPPGGVGPMQDSVDTVNHGNDTTKIGTSDALIGDQPKLTHTTWAQAQAAKDPSALLTTKGKVLTTLLQAGLGAMAGDAAAREGTPRTGYPGLGAAGVAGVNSTFLQKQKQNMLAKEDLEQEKEKAQIAALPQQAQALLAETRARTDYLKAGADTRGLRKVGDKIIDRDGNEVYGGLTPEEIAANAAAKASGTAKGKGEAVKAAGGTPEQVLSALGVKPNKQNTTSAQMYLDAADGDPKEAIKRMNADKVANSNAIHSTIAKLHAADSGNTPAMRATVNSDPQYTGLKKQRDTMVTKLATMETSGFADPKEVATVQSQADALTEKMVNRRAELMKKPGAPTSALPQSRQDVAPKYKAGDSVMYKGRQHRVAGYDSSGKLQLNP